MSLREPVSPMKGGPRCAAMGLLPSPEGGRLATTAGNAATTEQSKRTGSEGLSPNILKLSEAMPGRAQAVASLGSAGTEPPPRSAYALRAGAMAWARMFGLCGSLYGDEYDDRFAARMRTDLARHGLGRPDPDVAEMRRRK